MTDAPHPFTGWVDIPHQAAEPEQHHRGTEIFQMLDHLCVDHLWICLDGYLEGIFARVFEDCFTKVNCYSNDVKIYLPGRSLSQQLPSSG